MTTARDKGYDSGIDLRIRKAEPDAAVAEGSAQGSQNVRRIRDDEAGSAGGAAHPGGGRKAAAMSGIQGIGGRTPHLSPGWNARAGRKGFLLLLLLALCGFPAPAFTEDGPAWRRDIHESALPPLPREWRNSIRRVQLPEGTKLIAFTFDLCEREHGASGYDAAVVDALRTNHARATFFASGKWMQSHPEQTVQLMADPLFEVGGHGWAHENFRLLDKTEAEKRFLRTQAFYESLRDEALRRAGADPAAEERISRQPLVFRFPFGTCNADALEMLASSGVAAIQWDVVSGDAVQTGTAEAVSGTVLSRAKPGSIVVFHANGRGHGTARALPGLIAALRSRGFEFVTASELLRAGKPIASPECYELSPGDNKRYDKYR